MVNRDMDLSLFDEEAEETQARRNQETFDPHLSTVRPSGGAGCQDNSAADQPDSTEYYQKSRQQILRTQARVVWQNEEPQGPAWVAKEMVQNYVRQALQLGKEAISQVESSEYGKKLDLKILEKFEIFSTNAQHLQKQLAPYIDQAREQVAKEYERDLSVAKEKIQPILEQFQKRWEDDVKNYQKKLNPLAADLQKQAKDSLEALSKTLLPIAEEFRDKMRTDVDQLRVRIAPHTDELRQQVAKKLEEVRAKAGPQAEEYRAQLSSQIEAWREKVGPIAQQLKERLIPHAEEVQSKLNILYERLKAHFSPAA